MTILAMSIDQRRAKRKTTTLPGVLPEDLAARPARLATEGGTETNTVDEPADDKFE